MLCQDGRLIAGASAEEADLLYKFGYDLGLAFQIADDWLDTYGDPAVFGKAIGGDIVNNKKSWLLTRALEKAGTERLSGALAMPVSTDEEKEKKIAAVKTIYEDLGIEQEAQKEIMRFHNQAMGYVEKLNLGKIKSEMLHRYADMLLGRRK
jgi:geranylgeranyl diphosphate synthase type II